MDSEPTIKEMYDAAVAQGSTISYGVFRKKLLRLLDGNVRTTNRVMRDVGMAVNVRRRKFVAYDGEGDKDRYFLLANSLGEVLKTPGEYGRDLRALSTQECLDYLSTKYDNTVYRVFFSFGYDVNHITRDFSDRQINDLYSGKIVWYGKHRVLLRPGKILEVDRFQYYDVFSFFSRSFIKTVELMLGKDAVPPEITEGKEARGNFDDWPVDKIVAYNALELQLLVDVCEKLRVALERIGVNLHKWYGPGCIAMEWFKQYNIKPLEQSGEAGVMSAECKDALERAYYGGRFEQMGLGKWKNIYQYDIHSAYPSVAYTMPNFVSWSHAKKFVENEYSIWYITFDLRDDIKYDQEKFLPLPVRSVDGRVCYPAVGKGWYWYPEIKVLLDYFPNAKVTVHEGFIAKTEGQPFAWIKEKYDYRMRLKAEGDLSQYALKVGLNSLYGKMAQRVGKAPFFSLSWAGYITAATRAKLARAGYQVGSEHVIGFATDALVTDKRCTKLTLSDELGDWEETKYDYGLFFQSGVYRMYTWDRVNAEWKHSDHYRGNAGRNGIDDMIEQIKAHPYERPKVKVRRFITNILAIRAPAIYGPARRQFLDTVTTMKLDAVYKRHYYDMVDIAATRKSGGDNFVYNYGKMLEEPIHSVCMVYQKDHWIDIHNAALEVSIEELEGIESFPQKRQDPHAEPMYDEVVDIADALDSTDEDIDTFYYDLPDYETMKAEVVNGIVIHDLDD